MALLIRVIIASFSILLVLSIFAIFGKYVQKKKYLENRKNYFLTNIFEYIIKSFNFLYNPFLIITIVFSVIHIFPPFNNYYFLIPTVILTIAAIIIERVSEHLKINVFFNAPYDYCNDNTAVFSYIDLYCDIEKINQGLIQQISTSQTNMLTQFDKMSDEINALINNIKYHIELQNIECKTLLEKKNNIDNLLIELNNNVKIFNEYFSEYEKKLYYTSKLIEYYDESNNLLTDINESFLPSFKKSSNDFMKRFDDLEQQLKRIVDEYSKLNNYIEPHTQKISVYNSKMDSVLQIFKYEIESKHMLLDITNKDIASTIKEMNKRINETLHNLNIYLKNNTFLLSKISDTFKNNSVTNRHLKKLLINWSEILE